MNSTFSRPYKTFFGLPYDKLERLLVASIFLSSLKFCLNIVLGKQFHFYPQKMELAKSINKYKMH